MKRAVSISIGSSKRDKMVDVELLGQQVRIERIGTDGDMEKAARLYQELDGQVDAFGVGGAVLGLLLERDWYPLHSVLPMIRYVHKTPVVDGSGLKMTLERKAAPIILSQLGDHLSEKKAFVLVATDRWGMLRTFVDAGFECVFGDLMFTLGLPIPIRTESSVRTLTSILAPVISRLPFEWVYPVGEKQEERAPKFGKYFQWCDVVAGDCHYITRYMPDRMDGKIILTNTTTQEDRELFRKAGVKYLVTTTPVLDGRSFGTNMMEAALIAAIGRKEPVDYAHPANYFDELDSLLEQIHLEPQVQELN